MGKLGWLLKLLLVVLAIHGVFAGWQLSSDLRRERENPSEHAQGKKPEPGDYGPFAGGVYPIAFAAEIAASDALHGYAAYCKKREHAEEKEWLGNFWCDVKITDAAVAIFTIALAVFTLALWLATRDLVRGAEETSRRQLRAYIHITSCRVDNLYDLATFWLEYKNAGQTPAYDVKSWSYLTLKDFPNNANFEEKGEVIAHGSLGPGAFHHYPKKGPRKLTMQELSDVFAQRKAIYLFGEITYRDAFGVKRITTYRHMVGGINGVDANWRLGTCPEGNEAT